MLNKKQIKNPATTPTNTPIVIAVDPGYDRFGIAIIKKEPTGKDTLVYSGFVQTDSKIEFVLRLQTVIDEFKSTIKKFSPEFLAVETLFFSNNQKTAMHVAEVRGAVLYTAKEAGLKIMEIHPLKIKQAITGDGKSDKAQIIKMIELLTGLKKKTKDDEYDAIAVGLAFMAMYKNGYSQLV